jgi:nuclear pore complex protein Nup155
MTYNEQPDNITSVAIVKPRPGVFIDDITYVLVICTPITVLLIGVVCTTGKLANNRTHKEIQLYATEMSITTEVEMTCVVGMDDGRIFLAGAQDGNLYELHYQEKEGWFGKRIQLINHSVGGMQSLLPKFASSASDGQFFLLLGKEKSHTCYRSRRIACFRSCSRHLLRSEYPERHLRVQAYGSQVG